MKIPTLLILAFSAIASSSVQLSDDMPEGVFIADISSGKLSNLEMLTVPKPNETAGIDDLPGWPCGGNGRGDRMKRRLPITQASCKDFFFPKSVEKDYGKSLENLQHYCGRKPCITSRYVLISRVGSAIIYFCNYGLPIYCMADELDDDITTLNDRCNTFHRTGPGFVWHKGVQKTLAAIDPTPPTNGVVPSAVRAGRIFLIAQEPFRREPVQARILARIAAGGIEIADN
ncbi:hypothetical protein F4818DRAFT_453098 [Hypoxylon cercidicola]|nr:hypothetical protein F4818DRAFT_453098 [Hypoxylon cercidicola]